MAMGGVRVDDKGMGKIDGSDVVWTLGTAEALGKLCGRTVASPESDGMLAFPGHVRLVQDR
jgi:hypothetical protein